MEVIEQANQEAFQVAKTEHEDCHQQNNGPIGAVRRFDRKCISQKGEAEPGVLFLKHLYLC